MGLCYHCCPEPILCSYIICPSLFLQDSAGAEADQADDLYANYVPQKVKEGIPHPDPVSHKLFPEERAILSYLSGLSKASSIVDNE